MDRRPRRADLQKPSEAMARQGVLPLIGAEVKPVQTTSLETALAPHH